MTKKGYESLISGCEYECVRFGKGLVICLMKFATHKVESYMTYNGQNIYISEEKAEEMKNMSESEIDSLPNCFGCSYSNSRNSCKICKMAVKCESNRSARDWASGAWEHLNYLLIPKGNGWKTIREKLIQLRDGTYIISRDRFQDRNSRRYNTQDVIKLKALSREIAMMIDEKLGLDPELGDID